MEAGDEQSIAVKPLSEKQLEKCSRGNKPVLPVDYHAFEYLNAKEVNRYLRSAIVNFHNQTLLSDALPRDAFRRIDTDSEVSIVFSSMHLKRALSRFLLD